MTFTGVYIGLFASRGMGEFTEWKIKTLQRALPPE
jgi:hypothetical protein